jgi:hypothetical protein
MRTVLFALALAATGCAKKSKAVPAAPTATESAPGSATGAPAEADDDKGKSTEKGDPCDGGETKGK